MVIFEYNPMDKHLICKFSGHLDTNMSLLISEEIQNKISELQQGKTEGDKLEEKIDFDMTGVDFISSSFIRICLVVSNQTGEGGFSIFNCNPFLKKTLKIAGLNDLLHVS